MMKPLHGIKNQIKKDRDGLNKAQNDLLIDKMDIHKIWECQNVYIINLSTIEENLLRQKAKIEWIRLGDNNNAYFYETLKSKYNQARIRYLKDKNGRHITDQAKIKEEIFKFCGDLVGKDAMREGK